MLTFIKISSNHAISITRIFNENSIDWRMKQMKLNSNLEIFKGLFGHKKIGITDSFLLE